MAPAPTAEPRARRRRKRPLRQRRWQRLRVPKPPPTRRAPGRPLSPHRAPRLLHAPARCGSRIEVSEWRGQTLISRLVHAGEDVGLDGVAPLRVKIGNASGTEVVFRGKPMELAPFTRDNLARLEPK